MKEGIKFPEDFEKGPHHMIAGATSWLLKNEQGKTLISIVGGGKDGYLYGDGINTFEMYDFSEDGPRDYLTEEEINEHLKDFPITL
jgi:hypothetical protein